MALLSLRTESPRERRNSFWCPPRRPKILLTPPLLHQIKVALCCSVIFIAVTRVEGFLGRRIANFRAPRAVYPVQFWQHTNEITQ